MRKIIILLVVTFMLVGTAYATKKPVTKIEKISYAIGMNIATNMMAQKLEIDADQLAAGLTATLNKQDTALTPQEMGDVLMAFQQEMQAKKMAEAAAEAAKNEKLAKDFLDSNSKKEGVVTLDSGLQYKVLTKGTGESPKADSMVEVHYKGTLMDGTVFDSSYDRGEPAQFPVNKVIKGWTEALQLMKVGSKWQIVIPANLAYGEQGAPPMIPPNSVLVFDVELLKIL